MAGVGSNLAPEIEEVRQRLRNDCPFWARNCATILTDDKIPVRLNARPWQLEFDAALEKQRAAGQPMRAIILKARKLGFSTWVQAKLMQRVTQLPNQYALVAAQDRKTAGVLYDMSKRIWRHLPDDRQLAQLLYGPGTMQAPPFSIKPEWCGGSETRADNKWMTLGDKMRREDASIYETLTAGSNAAGRGYTPSGIHCSEVAHWENPNFKIGLLNALPMRPETIAVLESTANGFNDFHEMWTRAVAGAADPETGGLYVPLFFGWQDNPFNRREFASDQARERFERTVGDPAGGGDEEEPWLQEQFEVELEQLFWRRTVLHGPEINSKIEQFHQEHPATAEQAFIGSGTPVFAGILVSRMIKAAEEAPAPVEGVLRGAEWRERKTRAGVVRIPQSAVWVPGDQVTPEDLEVWGGVRERLLVWQHPVNEETQKGLEPYKREPDGQYVAFADIALGRDQTSGERDWTVVQVLDHVSRLQVARYRSRIAVHELPMVLFLIGLYFNKAHLAPEVNGPGQGVIDVLAKDMHYSPLYNRHRRGDDRRPDMAGMLLGWLTTGPTKVLMEQSFGEALKDGTHGCRDVPTAREATTYVEDEKNRHGAQKGTNDDLLMAFMGAHRIASELRPRDPKKKRKSGRHVGDSLTGW